MFAYSEPNPPPPLGKGGHEIMLSHIDIETDRIFVAYPNISLDRTSDKMRTEFTNQFASDLRCNDGLLAKLSLRTVDVEDKVDNVFFTQRVQQATVDRACSSDNLKNSYNVHCLDQRERELFKSNLLRAVSQFMVNVRVRKARERAEKNGVQTDAAWEKAEEEKAWKAPMGVPLIVIGGNYRGNGIVELRDDLAKSFLVLVLNEDYTSQVGQDGQQIGENLPVC